MSTKTPGPKRTFYLLPEQGFLNVSHTILFMPPLLCFYYKSLSHSWSGHTHTHTHKHALTACILHYIIPLLVGLVPWVGRESEWSHYTTVTSLLQSPQQPGVLQQQKQHNRVISSLQLQHNVQGVLCISIYIYLLKSHSSLSPSCSTAVQSLGGIWCSQWGFCWTMEKQLWQGSGRCEVFSSSQSSKDEFERSEAWKNMVKWLNQSQNSDWKESLDAGGLPLAFTEAAVKRESVVTFLAHRYYTTVI